MICRYCHNTTSSSVGGIIDECTKCLGNPVFYSDVFNSFWIDLNFKINNKNYLVAIDLDLKRVNLYLDGKTYQLCVSHLSSPQEIQKVLERFLKMKAFL